jgi:hypothetical protein
MEGVEMETNPIRPASIGPRLTGLVKQELEERRFAALADAIVDHQARARTLVAGERRHDRALYERLREIRARRP